MGVNSQSRYNIALGNERFGGRRRLLQANSECCVTMKLQMTVPVGLNVWSRLAEELFPYLDQVVGPFDMETACGLHNLRGDFRCAV